MTVSGFDLAVRNIASQGETDVFPRGFEGQVFNDEPAAVTQLLESIHREFRDRLSASPPSAERALAAVGYTGFRWATLIDPIWNAYLLAITLEAAPAIESERRRYVDDRVFSYRYAPDPATGRLFAEDGWRRFQEASLRALDESPLVLVTDIADFYPRVYHHRLKNQLQRLLPDSDTPFRIDKILDALADGYSFGLPVGGPAARILAEAAITPVDRLMASNGLKFHRYADDYHVYVDSRDEAYGALTRISEVLRPEGLSLQKSKTHVMTAAELRRRIDFDASIESDAANGPISTETSQFLRLTLHYDPYSPTANDDYERLRQDVIKFDILGMLAAEIKKSQIHVGLTRRLLRALKFLDGPMRFRAVLSLVQNLDILTPVIPSVMLSVADILTSFDQDDRERIVSVIQERIERNDHLFSVNINMAFALRVLVHHYTPKGEQTITKLFRNMDHFVRRDIILLLAEWGATHWLSEQRSSYSTFTPTEKRAFLLASYKLGDEGSHWRDRQEFVGFDKTVRDWMSARSMAGKSRMPIWSS